MNLLDSFLFALVGNPEGSCCTKGRDAVDQDDLDGECKADQDVTPRSKAQGGSELLGAELPVGAPLPGAEPPLTVGVTAECSEIEAKWSEANPEANSTPTLPEARPEASSLAEPLAKGGSVAEPPAKEKAKPGPLAVPLAKAGPLAEPLEVGSPKVSGGTAAVRSASAGAPKAKAKSKPKAKAKAKVKVVEAKPPRKKPSEILREREEEIEKNKHKYRQLVDDIVGGKFKKEGGGQVAGDMRIIEPTPYERKNTRMIVLEGFRAQYGKLGKSKNCPSGQMEQEEEDRRMEAATALIPSYSASQTAGLTIEGGHKSLLRPRGVNLPKDFRKPWKGCGEKKHKAEDGRAIITVEELAKFDCESKGRMMVSVYGDVFDVSDRPDKYGPNGPYHWMTGHDLTWGFVSGKDVPETVDQYYDLWKIAPPTFRDDKLRCILAWVGFYEYEYGNSIAQLEKYRVENGLRGPPMEESNECSVM